MTVETVLLARPEEGRVLGGVCAAIAARWQLDVHLVRIAFALLGFAHGIGVGLYLLAWLLWPTADGAPGGVFAVLRGNAADVVAGLGRAWQRLGAAWQRTERSASPWPPSRRWIGLGLASFGAAIVLRSAGMFAWLGGWATVGVLAIVLGLAIAVVSSTAADEQVRP